MVKTAKKSSQPVNKIKVEIDQSKIEILIDEIEHSNLTGKTREILKGCLFTLLELDRLIGLKQTSLDRLRKIFGKKIEKRINEAQAKAKQKETKQSPKDLKRNGRHGVEEYVSAKTEDHSHKELGSGDHCPECKKGKVYSVDPGTHVRVTGSAPLAVTVHRTEKLRCNLCEKIFEADFPDKNAEKYDSTAKAVIAVMHYHSSLPFYRLEKLQKNFGLPIPRSTMWSEMEKLANRVQGVWKTMVSLSAQQELMHVDDTSARVYSLFKENELNKDNSSYRKGMFTTGILSKSEDNLAVMYFTGRKHAGENLKILLEKRTADKSLILMSDALSRNTPKKDQQNIIRSLCLAHGRRQFFDLQKDFDEEVDFVLGKIAMVYGHDKHCKQNQYDDKKRLAYHREKSQQPMQELKTWLDDAFTSKKVEPNSTLGKGIKYLRKHWKGLTEFLRTLGAPLDNNLLEQQLRTPVLNRKNWLFYRNTLGALVGDILLSLIKTCELNHVNAFHYLTSVYDYPFEVDKYPEQWMPWNYTEALKRTKAAITQLPVITES